MISKPSDEDFVGFRPTLFPAAPTYLASCRRLFFRLFSPRPAVLPISRQLHRIVFSWAISDSLYFYWFWLIWRFSDGCIFMVFTILAILYSTHFLPFSPFSDGCPF